MPLNAETIGRSTRSIRATAEARWTMAYAAALLDSNPRYLDTAAGDVLAHPVFPVCLEWPACLAVGDIEGNEILTQQERHRGVHAYHDIHLLSPLVAGRTYETKATIIGIDRRRAGSAQILRLDTVNVATGQVVVRTYQTGLYRDVEIVGKPGFAETLPEAPTFEEHLSTSARSFEIDIPSGLAHTYTECARIWNPVHTDRKVALRSGLPDIILHGTATLALAVSRLVEHFCDGEPTRVSRVGCKFTGMVFMPSVLALRAWREGTTIGFDLLNQDGASVLRQGFLCMSSHR